MMLIFLLNPTTIHSCIYCFRKKAFLVEGPTEFLLLPAFYKQLTSHTIEEDNISIISCNGISYNRYLRVVEDTDKKIAVLTDNDN
ncbi:TOPRIM nucleotidyl transferase/hydrolase domain-containing protein, partial [Sutterella wadsworthensis]|uniref:TOPRIM nucleotidyl transferase/hydrolase domain-containing protein n=1 Tax=Sutterella wadsworthensis TaxID=40545 RepID=UPI003AB93BA3